ncbi:helix-turn-helix transcriptional regulator, partial [Streptomyces sp. E5N298]
MSGGDEETAQVMTSLGARLRAIRQARGLTLAQLAAVTGISVSTLSRL